jgi:hypothetical protein
MLRVLNKIQVTPVICAFTIRVFASHGFYFHIMSTIILSAAME